MSEEMGNKHIETKTDPLSRFMFGPSKRTSSGNDYGFDERQESNRTEELLEVHRNNELNDEWLFGTRPNKSLENSAEKHQENSKFNQIVNNINFTELMDNIDILVSSAHQLKPLYKKVSPFINQFLKK